MVSEFGSNRLTELSYLELALLLDGFIEHLETNPKEEKKGQMKTRYNSLVDQLKNTTTREELLANPQIQIKRNGRLTTSIHPNQKLRLIKRLEQIKNPIYGESSFQQYCRNRFDTETYWISEQQKRVIQLLAGKQARFIISENAIDLKKIRQSEIASETRLVNTLTRLTKNTSVELPSGLVIMPSLLMPGNRFAQLVSNYIFNVTNKETSPIEITRILRDSYAPGITSKKVTKYIARPPICK